MRRFSNLRKLFSYLLVLFVIYPVSTVIFRELLALREPVFICPIKIEGDVPIRSDAMGNGHFGARRSKGKRWHKGIDIVAKTGEGVFAAKSGFAKTGEVLGGMGKYVKILHMDGYVTIYGHLSAIGVTDNRWVWRGQKIGEAGKTGNANYNSMKSHLHFEIRKDGVPQDPLLCIKK